MSQGNGGVFKTAANQEKEKTHICWRRGLYENKLLVFRKLAVLEGKGLAVFSWINFCYRRAVDNSLMILDINAVSGSDIPISFKRTIKNLNVFELFSR
jgi:hypothetical protein